MLKKIALLVCTFLSLDFSPAMQEVIFSKNLIVGYQGPGNVLSGATAWWGVRCYTNTYSGNILDIWDSATGSTTETVLGCDGAGNVVVKSGSPLDTTCGVGTNNCRVKTANDQSGNTNCTGVACDISQTTNANRPQYVRNCITTKPCIRFSGSQVLTTGGNNFTQGGQPPGFTIVAVAKTTNTGLAQDLIIPNGSGGNVILQWNGTANTVAIFAGSNVTASVFSDSTMGAILGVINNTACYIYSNGSQVAGPSTCGTRVGDSVLSMGAANVGLAAPLTGDVTEGGIYSGDQKSSAASLKNNQQLYYGF